jgi:hypothetical protein
MRRSIFVRVKENFNLGEKGDCNKKSLKKSKCASKEEAS